MKFWESPYVLDKLSRVGDGTPLALALSLQRNKSVSEEEDDVVLELWMEDAILFDSVYRPLDIERAP